MRNSSRRVATKRFGRAAFVAVAALALSLSCGAAAITSSQMFDESVALANTATTDDLDVMRSAYANTVQGCAFLVDGSVFGIEESKGGQGPTTVYLNGSMAGTPDSWGSYFTVSYNPQWDGNPSVDQYLEGKLFAAQMEYPESFIQIHEGAYESVGIAGVSMSAIAYYTEDPYNGVMLFHLDAVEVNPAGGVVYWELVTSNDEMDVVMQGLTEAVATFKTDPMAFDGASIIWTNPSSLATRPISIGSSSSTGTSTSGGSKGTSTTGTGTTGSSSSAMSYETVEYTDGYSFRVKIPKGWNITIYGEGAEACLEAYDPKDPSIRMLYYGDQLMPSDQYTAEALGFPFVLDPITMENYIAHLPEICDYSEAAGMSGMPDLVRMSSVDVLEVLPSSAMTDTLARMGADTSIIADEAVVEARMTLEDAASTEVIGVFNAIIINSEYQGYSFGEALMVYGVVAPPDKIEAVFGALSESGCIGSFEVLDTYQG